MSVFLGLCYSELCLSGFRKDFSYCIVGIFLWINDMESRESGIIRSHRAVMQGYGFHPEFRKVFLCKGYGKFLSPVVSEVEEDHYISGLQQTDSLAVFADN